MSNDTRAAPMSPAALAAEVAPLLTRALVGFDVDGVLAPIVEKANEARLLPGVLDGLERIAMHSRVVIVSGRSVDDLERFRFPPTIEVIGSHGLERRGMPPLALDDDERYVFEQLEILATRAVDAAGDGAWLEYKPASVVIHVREADRDLADRAVDAVGNLAAVIDGAHVQHGHMVCELLARTGSKGDAIARLRESGQPVVFLGDDVTDESVFEQMRDGDIGVRVGAGETAAHFRLDGPDAVVQFLHRL
jgi:trehalose 6-phosphate phosphatase